MVRDRLVICQGCGKEFYFFKHSPKCNHCGLSVEKWKDKYLFSFNGIFLDWKLKQVKAVSKEIFLKELELVKLKKKLKSLSLVPQKEPRYDDVYFKGVKWMDENG